MNAVVFFAVIALALLCVYGAYQGIGKMVDKAWESGFNTGSSFQKDIDDARAMGEKIKKERNNNKHNQPEFKLNLI